MNTTVKKSWTCKLTDEGIMLKCNKQQIDPGRILVVDNLIMEEVDPKMPVLILALTGTNNTIQAFVVFYAKRNQIYDLYTGGNLSVVNSANVSWSSKIQIETNRHNFRFADVEEKTVFLHILKCHGYTINEERLLVKTRWVPERGESYWAVSSNEDRPDDDMFFSSSDELKNTSHFGNSTYLFKSKAACDNACRILNETLLSLSQETGLHTTEEENTKEPKLDQHQEYVDIYLTDLGSCGKFRVIKAIAPFKNESLDSIHRQINSFLDCKKTSPVIIAKNVEKELALRMLSRMQRDLTEDVLFKMVEVSED